MPAEVVLTRRSAPASTSGSDASGSGVPPSRRVSASARAEVRLATRDLAEAARDQRIDDGPRRAAGADHHGTTLVNGPALGLRVERTDEAGAVGRVSPEFSTVHPQRVDRAEPLGRGRQPFAQLRHGFLVRDGDVAADVIARTQPGDEGVQFLRRHGDLLVGAGHAVAGQPVPVDRRRARMRDRPTDDARVPDPDHTSTAPIPRRMRSRGSMGRPRMVDCSPSILSNKWMPSPSTA